MAVAVAADDGKEQSSKVAVAPPATALLAATLHVRINDESVHQDFSIVSILEF
jgi:hypothetical protein